MSDQPSTAEAVLSHLQEKAGADTLEAMTTRYGIHTEKAMGVPMRDMKALAKRLGTNHDLAIELWNTGWYEARIVASMVDDPEAVTSEQMEAWVEEFDNWAVVDTVCFNLFDRTPHAWEKVGEWAMGNEEFVKRAAFALLWSLAAHDSRSQDGRFLHGLTLIESEAGDGRHLVDKAIGMALRAIGKRRTSLLPEALAVAERLAASDIPDAQKIGRQAARELRKIS